MHKFKSNLKPASYLFKF